MSYKFPSSLWMIRILARRHAWYKYVKYGLSLVNLGKLGLIRKKLKKSLWSWKISSPAVREKVAKMAKKSNSNSWEVLLTTLSPECIRGKPYKDKHISYFFIFLSSPFYFPKRRETKHVTRAFTLRKNNYSLKHF